MQSNQQTWHPGYWKNEQHGQAWERVKDALKRDWEQTKADVGVSSGRELNQQVGNTVKQATGSEVIPPAGQPNAGAEKKPSWDDVEPALQYGFGAHEQYRTTFKTWDDTVESKLEKEWDEKQTGKPFKEVKPFVKRGWDHQ
ncbi:MAG: hypothetical protein JNG84_10095 [Archangium sp.]|nr:hypothetical protein [Archangium sp.]